MAQSKNRSLTVAKSAGSKPHVYWRNEKSYVFSASALKALATEITENPQQSVRYYARATGMTPDQVNCAIERNQAIRKLARSGMVAVMDRGRRPAWYHEMAIAQQKLVPMVSREDQYTAIAEDVLPGSIVVDDETIREDSELATRLFNRILARTNLSNNSALALANEMQEIVQFNAEVAASAKRDIQALAHSANSITMRLSSPTKRVAAE